MHINTNKRSGYTLIEVLVALTVFAILATITASIMLQAFDTRSRVTRQTNQLNQLQLMMIWIERDMQQVIRRHVTGPDHRVFPALLGLPNYFEFTHNTTAIDATMPLSNQLQRTAYLCNGSKLVRRYWEMLDTPNRKDFHDKVLLDNLLQCQFDYLTARREVLNEWHAVEKYPIAFRLTLKSQTWGEASLLFVIPEGLYDSSAL